MNFPVRDPVHMRATPRVLTGNRDMARICIACALVVVAVSTLTGTLLQNAPQQPVSPANEETAYLCPMHPDYTMDAAGECPRCGMALVLAAAYDVRDYRLDFRTNPAVVVAGRKATLQFKVS